MTRLAHAFPDPELNRTLELFVRMLMDFFGERLVSVILHGSVVFDDLVPGYGDLDFVAVVEGDLSEETCGRLVELRKALRGGERGILAQMIEGAFLPRRMLDPAASGSAFWWGTTGERPWTKSRLGWLVLRVIREHGIVIWGEDTRDEIPAVTREAVLEELREFPDSAREHSKDGGLHSVDWLLTAARLLFWLREDKLSSKSEAANWGQVHAKGAWRAFLPRAKELRLNPALADLPEWKRWLAELAAPIKEAADEVQQELARQGFRGPEASERTA